MKIRCDVCEKAEATVFCSADEAALCDECDRRVHCANKLAGQHARYSLLHPTYKGSPLCDICQVCYSPPPLWYESGGGKLSAEADPLSPGFLTVNGPTEIGWNGIGGA